MNKHDPHAVIRSTANSSIGGSWGAITRAGKFLLALWLVLGEGGSLLSDGKFVETNVGKATHALGLTAGFLLLVTDARRPTRLE